jgi:hypothetical protein
MFWGLKGQRGGAIYSINTKVEILSSTFVKNYAAEAGGSLYLSCQTSNSQGKKLFLLIDIDCKFLVRDNTFAGNRA